VVFGCNGYIGYICLQWSHGFLHLVAVVARVAFTCLVFALVAFVVFPALLHGFHWLNSTTLMCICLHWVALGCIELNLVAFGCTWLHLLAIGCNDCIWVHVIRAHMGTHHGAHMGSQHEPSGPLNALCIKSMYV